MPQDNDDSRETLLLCWSAWIWSQMKHRMQRLSLIIRSASCSHSVYHRDVLLVHWWKRPWCSSVCGLLIKLNRSLTWTLVLATLWRRLLVGPILSNGIGISSATIYFRSSVNKNRGQTGLRLRHWQVCTRLVKALLTVHMIFGRVVSLIHVTRLICLLSLSTVVWVWWTFFLPRIVWQNWCSGTSSRGTVSCNAHRSLLMTKKLQPMQVIMALGLVPVLMLWTTMSHLLGIWTFSL